jgi:hypothetical protein
VKDKNRWSIAVDGITWDETFDMIWNPIFSPCSKNVIAKAEKNGKYMVSLNGKSQGKSYDKLWEPIFSPDGEKILLRYLEDEKYYREVIKL